MRVMHHRSNTLQCIVCPFYLDHTLVILFMAVLPHHSVDVEPEPLHTASIFLDHPLAFLLGVITAREEHAFVTGGFLVFAHTAWL